MMEQSLKLQICGVKVNRQSIGNNVSQIMRNLIMNEGNNNF